MGVKFYLGERKQGKEIKTRQLQILIIIMKREGKEKEKETQ